MGGWVEGWMSWWVGGWVNGGLGRVMNELVSGWMGE